jgi:hypothetical protein
LAPVSTALLYNADAIALNSATHLAAALTASKIGIFLGSAAAAVSNLDTWQLHSWGLLLAGFPGIFVYNI